MLTIFIATYNGAGTLPKTLRAMRNLASPKGGWKIVVIDNGSTDNAKAVIDGFKSELPITYCFEGKRGKNAALNKGLELLEGDLAVFTDDDVIPREDWLLQLRAAAARHPDYDIFGGTIRPLWEVPPDPIVLKAVPLGVVYALTSDHWEEGPVPPKWIWGPNMAIRAHLFEQFRFDEGVGPDGSTNYVMGSETEFTDRLARHGFKCWHCKDAVVQHIIKPHQLERSWVLRRAQRYGRSVYRGQLPRFGRPVPLVFGYPRFLLRRIGETAAAVAVSHLTGNRAAALKSRWDFNFLIGQAKEGRELAEQNSTASSDGKKMSIHQE